MVVWHIIEIEYADNQMKKIMEDYAKMTKRIGLERAKATKKRIDQLRASVSFGGFLALRVGKPHRLKGNMSNFYKIDISDNFRLIVEPDCESFAPEVLIKCTAITVKGVVDYHGGKENWLIS